MSEEQQRPPRGSADFWDARYAEADRIWSGEANRRLVEQVADLPPGAALDVGCGEGGDAVWLAARGWTVTGLDLSRVALERASEHAEQAGVADRTTFRHVDLLVDEEPLGEHDLVSAQFLHLPGTDFDRVYRRLAAAVRPGGSLVVAGHHPADLATPLRRPRDPDLLMTPERVVAVLDPAEWDVRLAATPTRDQDLDGVAVTATDTVVHAVRR